KLPPGKYARGENIVNRGGIVQCRPGYRCLTALAPGRLQGFAKFKPKVGAKQLVFMVDGLLYVSDPPFTSARRLSDVTFLPEARQAYFALVEQSVQQNADGSLTLINPRNLLVIQDGAFSPAAYYDGTR